MKRNFDTSSHSRAHISSKNAQCKIGIFSGSPCDDESPIHFSNRSIQKPKQNERKKKTSDREGALWKRSNRIKGNFKLQLTTTTTTKKTNTAYSTSALEYERISKNEKIP